MYLGGVCNLHSLGSRILVVYHLLASSIYGRMTMVGYRAPSASRQGIRRGEGRHSKD